MTPAPGKWGVSPVLGHDNLWNILTRIETYPAIHFLGPEGVGRAKFAKEWHWKINGTTSTDDFLYMRNPLVADFEDMRAFANMPPNAYHRTIAIEFEHTITDTQAARTAALLDDPLQTKFILITSKELPEVLSSRVMTYVFQPLSDDVVASILRNRGVPAERAKDYAAKSGGSIAKAIAMRDDEKPKTVALALLTAIVERNTRPLNSVEKSWNQDVRLALRVWLRESLTQAWKVYTSEDDKQLSRPEKIALLKATSKGSSGRNEVRRVAEDIIRGGTGV